MIRRAADDADIRQAIAATPPPADAADYASSMPACAERMMRILLPPLPRQLI